MIHALSRMAKKSAHSLEREITCPIPASSGPSSFPSPIQIGSLIKPAIRTGASNLLLQYTQHIRIIVDRQNSFSVQN
jgi:hypothetical protein